MPLVAFLHPAGWTEALVGAATASAVTLLGPAPRADVVDELGHLTPVVVFLMPILLVAEIRAEEGVFAWLGAVLWAPVVR